MDSKRPKLMGSANGSAPVPRRTPEDIDIDEDVEEAVAREIDNDQDDYAEVDFETALDVDLELDIGEAGRNWERPSAPHINPDAESLGRSSGPATRCKSQ
jgi:hypothetical protein